MDQLPLGEGLPDAVWEEIGVAQSLTCNRGVDRECPWGCSKSKVSVRVAKVPRLELDAVILQDIHAHAHTLQGLLIRCTADLGVSRVRGRCRESVGNAQWIRISARLAGSKDWLNAKR